MAIATTARAWDDQHLDLGAAAGQVRDARTSGFTAAVSGTAARFAAAWQRHVDGLATTAEARADGLRATAADLRTTDGLAAEQAYLLDSLLQEDR